MTEKTLKESLQKITKDKLVKKMKIAGLKYTGLDKTALVNILEEFLLKEENINRIWKGLSPFEREYVEEFLKYDESPGFKKIEHMYEKYGRENYMRNPWEKESQMNLLFVGESVPSQIKELLGRHLTPIVVSYNSLEQLPSDKNYYLNIIGESFSQDFCSVLNLVISVDLALTKEKRLPSKNTIIKMNNVLFNKDFVFKEIGGIDKIRSIEDTNRLYGIYMLLLESGLLYEDDDIKTSSYGEEFLSFRLVDKCKHLFKHYLKSQKIYELSRIVESDYKTKLKGNMSKCRSIIVKHLKSCPVGMWVPVGQFVDYIKMMDKKFLINEVKDISYFSDKHKIYLEPWVDWEEVEGRFIEVVLQEYLSVLGIVDTAIYETKGGCSDYDYLPFFKVDYFKITPLGAFVLGMSENYSYEEKAADSGFMVENGFQIKIIDTFSNQVHKLFFEQFAYQEEHTQCAIFTISFSSIIRALDKNITLESIIEYIQTNSRNGIPSQLLAAMHKWKENSDKVVIKNITVVQSENRELIEELKSDKSIKNYLVDDLCTAFEINPDSVTKVKKEIEKKEYYCRISGEK